MKNETKWLIDQSHSEITFKVKHLMIAHVKGSFKVFDANIYTTERDFMTAEIDLRIDSSSIITGDLKRDEHLKGDDFFDAKTHKQITFKSSTIGKPDAHGNHELWGELTIKGITKNVKFDVQFGGIINDASGNEKAGFTVTGKIKRSDWELVWNTTLEAGGLMIGDEIVISCEMELTNTGKKDLTMHVKEETTIDHEAGR
ncbi:MAG: YceI family protein [Bacteroidetes bacterium]|nr:YceI family protein [Bacteroidota bacterium]